MDMIFRLSALALLAAFASVFITPAKTAVTVCIGVAASVVIAVFAFEQLSPIFDFIRELQGLSGVADKTVLPLFKVVGISLVSKITSDICADAGEKGLASKMDIAGSVLAVAAVLPLLTLALELVKGLL